MVRKKRQPGVYINFRDRRSRRKSECLTVDDLTPKQAMDIVERVFSIPGITTRQVLARVTAFLSEEAQDAG